MTEYSDSRLYCLMLNLREDSLYVGQDVLDVLGSPGQVQMMINENEKKILLQACTVHDREALVVPPQPALYFQISGKSLLKKIRKLMKWEGDQARVLSGRRIQGFYAMEFDMKTAEIWDDDPDEGSVQ